MRVRNMAIRGKILNFPKNNIIAMLSLHCVTGTNARPLHDTELFNHLHRTIIRSNYTHNGKYVHTINKYFSLHYIYTMYY